MVDNLGTVSFASDIAIRHDVDVLVAGGGPAGVSAAVSAARQGAHVMLVEGHTCFGGMGTAGLVPMFCQFGDGINNLASGFGYDVLTRLREMNGTSPDDEGGPAPKLLAINVEVLKRLYDRMLIEAGVEFLLCTHVLAVEKSDSKISHVVAWAKSGIFAIKAKIFVDCTGDADLCAWAEAPFEKGLDGEIMPSTLCSLWADIDFQRHRESATSQGARIEEAYRDGVFSRLDLHLPGMVHCQPGIGGGNIGHLYGIDSTDERSLTRGLVEGRELITQYERYYREYVPGFENMKLVQTGSMMGIRESRRISGDYVLNVDDFLTRANFNDEIGRYAYCVDIHRSGDKEEHAKFLEEFHSMRYRPGESYGIPYRCLLPRGLDNVLVAGRCVSTDRYVQSSIRVMPGCFITGQAAGVAAAIAAGMNITTRELSIDQLRKSLKKLGAYMPQRQ